MLSSVALITLCTLLIIWYHRAGLYPLLSLGLMHSWNSNYSCRLTPIELAYLAILPVLPTLRTSLGSLIKFATCTIRYDYEQIQ